MSPVLPLLRQPVTHEWETPQALFDALDAEFGFQLDVAASADNAKCPMYFDVETDGLRQRWFGVVWCNPPYGSYVKRWVAKAYEESQRGATVVLLIAARTETRWWHDYVMKAAEIRFLRGRLRFSGATINAPFPNAVVVFRPGWRGVPVVSAMDAPRGEGMRTNA